MRITIKPFELRGFNLSPDIFHVYLRVYALNYFVRQSDGVIVQPGGPAESPFYDEWPCTRNNGSLLLPEIALESTLDALSPAHPESLRYYAGFFDPGGNMLCAFWPRPIFALDINPNPTTWAHVVAYNSPGVEFDWTTTHAEHYSKEEFNALLENPPQSFAGITVLPPLYFDGTTLWIPRASPTQDGYLAAEDFIAFSIGAGMGVISFNTRQGVIVLLSQDVLDALTYAPVNRAGDTLTGPLILAGHPSTGSPFEAATRGYVDSILGGGDVTPPTITSGPTTSGLTSSSVTITWTTNDSSDSQVQYSIDPDASYGTHSSTTNTPVSSAGVTSHSVTLSTLAAGTLYHYRVRSADAAGNPVLSAGGTFMTASGGGDTTPPIITLGSPPVTSILETSATINWTTSENADSEVRYSVDPDVSYGTATVPPITDTIPPGPGVTTHAVSLTGLVGATIYHYQVKSKDAAGNAATPVTGSFTTAAAPVDLLTSLIGYWKLDEASGNRLDSSGGSHTLAPTAAITTVAGKTGFNNCPQFVGDGNSLFAGDNTFAQMGSVDYTIAGWFQIADKAVSRDCISKVGGVGAGLDEYILGYDVASQKMRFTIQATNANYYTVLGTGFGDPAVNTWHLLVAWHIAGASTLNMQIDNGAVETFALVQPPGTRDAAFRIGCFGPAQYNFWSGLIDEVAVWKNRVLGMVERAALWSGGAGKPFDTW